MFLHVAPANDDSGNYNLNVLLFNHEGNDTADYGNFGVLYNMYDRDNFDFVLFTLR